MEQGFDEGIALVSKNSVFSDIITNVIKRSLDQIEVKLGKKLKSQLIIEF